MENKKSKGNILFIFLIVAILAVVIGWYVVYIGTLKANKNANSESNTANTYVEKNSTTNTESDILIKEHDANQESEIITSEVEL